MPRPTLRSAAPWVVLAAVTGLLAWKLRVSHFDWVGFARSCRSANAWMLLSALLVIQINMFLRAMRWAVFLRPALRLLGGRSVGWTKLIGPQFVGFTGVAIFGRIGELIRPILIARQTGLTVSSQIAVLTVERVFDLGAVGLIFSLNLLLSPRMQKLPYLHKAGLTIGGLTVALGLFVLLVRFAGGTVARGSERVLAPVSAKFARALAEKVRAFRDGLNVIDSVRDFMLAAGLSLFLWGTIAAAYLLTLRAFPTPVHEFGLAHTIVLMGFSIAGSALPIPGGGGAWVGNVGGGGGVFFVVGVFIFLGGGGARAAGAGLMVWLVTNMSVIPFGLVYARVEGISLRQVTGKSEAAEADRADLR